MADNANGRYVLSKDGTVVHHADCAKAPKGADKWEAGDGFATDAELRDWADRIGAASGVRLCSNCIG
jgi:hypothetical protein